MNSFYWHDYETWGTDPRWDRAVQFAGIRTDLDFNIIGKQLMVYARPADDFLPHPEACMVTGITPQLAMEEGVPEADFFELINQQLSQPGTCALGYNSIRFDDEFTRYGLYRNFFDPYAREWQNGNSRWDIIDMVRLMRALRPQGITWPENKEGVTSFKLEALTAANDIAHEGAHDALVDVKATIALAKLVKEKQPRLFDYVLNNRDKHKLAMQLDVRRQQPVLHVSSMYPASAGCLAVVVPVAQHPVNKNGILAYDLRVDPTPMLELSADELRERIYTRTEDLAEGQERIPLKTIHLNHAPVIVPMNTLTDDARESWQLDEAKETAHLKLIQQAKDLPEKIRQVFAESPYLSSSDPDQSLYDGFLSNSDRALCEQVRNALPENLADLHPAFKDAKLHELLFRYRARNWPHLLNKAEKQRWQEYRMNRLTAPDAGANITHLEYGKILSRMAVDSALSPDQRTLVNALLDWPEKIGLEE
jgi:exodeoxyribonuclease-1